MKPCTTIEPTENGWHLRHMGDVDEYERDSTEWGFENVNDTPLGDLKALQRMFYAILDECLHAYWSKHDEHRLRVIIVNQDGQEVE